MVNLVESTQIHMTCKLLTIIPLIKRTKILRKNTIQLVSKVFATMSGDIQSSSFLLPIGSKKEILMIKLRLLLSSTDSENGKL
jgi:hypothetical protein